MLIAPLIAIAGAGSLLGYTLKLCSSIKHKSDLLEALADSQKDFSWIESNHHTIAYITPAVKSVTAIRHGSGVFFRQADAERNHLDQNIRIKRWDFSFWPLKHIPVVLRQLTNKN